ncbi:MAG: ribonuclease HII [Methanomicrobiales archaeon]|nr:ribonuclease HII [Methanomicrobiales archaeon]
MICGVDEAGKGAVLGPLVVAGVCCGSEEECRRLGARDSKELTPSRRRELSRKIERQFRHAVISIEPAEIDAAMERSTLNDLLASAHAEIVRRLKPDVVYLDSCDVDAARFGGHVKGLLGFECSIHSLHGADRRHPVVGAASIIAKVRRDLAMEELCRVHGELGSGYPSDRITRKFLERYIAEHGAPPPYARKRWRTIARMMGEREQRRFPGA